MPFFPYTQGRYLKVVAEVMNKERANVRNALQGFKTIKELAQDRAKPTNPPGRQLNPADRDHFLTHWLTSNGSGGSVEFPTVSPDRIGKVLKEGFLRAIEAAENPLYLGSSASPLPISVAWFCTAHDDTFDVVNVVTPGVVVQVMLISPPPQTHPEHVGKQDNVIVTRLFQTAAAIQKTKSNLAKMGDPAPAIKNSKNNDTQPGEVGTFEIWS
jgi:hypothetical protein